MATGLSTNKLSNQAELFQSYVGNCQYDIQRLIRRSLFVPLFGITFEDFANYKDKTLEAVRTLNDELLEVFSRLMHPHQE